MIINWAAYYRWKYTPKGVRGLCMMCREWKEVFSRSECKMLCKSCKPIRWGY